MKYDVIKTKEDKKTGKLIITMEYDEEFAKLIKDFYDKKRLTKKLLTRFVIDAMMNLVTVNLVKGV